MDSGCYDNVCGLSLVGTGSRKSSLAEPPGEAKTTMKGAVNTVMAANRLDTQMFGRKWNDLTVEGQQQIIREKREARLRDQQEREEEQLRRVSIDNVTNTVRRQSETPDVLRMRGLSTTGTDLSGVLGEMVWTKAWKLSPEGSQPVLDSKAQYHNRKPNGWVSQEDLENIGVIYMKLPRNDLKQLDTMCTERGYLSIEREDVDLKSGSLKKWYNEHYSSSETMAYVKNGTCYYDLRDENNELIRVHLSEGDLLVIPPGLYHRFCLDQQQFVSIVRLTRDGDQTIIYREDPLSQSQPVRAAYLASRKRGSILEDNSFIK